MTEIKIGSSYKFVKNRDSEPLYVFEKHNHLEPTFYTDEDIMSGAEPGTSKHDPYINVGDIVLVCDLAVVRATLYSPQKQHTFEKGTETAVVYLFNNKMYVRPLSEFIEGTEHVAD